MTEQLYRTRPMSEKPTKDGHYPLVTARNNNWIMSGHYFENGEWLALPRTPLIGWLEPYTPSLDIDREPEGIVGKERESLKQLIWEKCGGAVNMEKIIQTIESKYHITRK